jgi:hypothetical protein
MGSTAETKRKVIFFPSSSQKDLEILPRARDSFFLEHSGSTTDE